MESAQIISFGRGVAPLAAGEPADDSPSFYRRRTDIDLVGIAQRIGMAGRPARAIVEAVRALVKKKGFPPPKSPRIVKGEVIEGPRAVWVRSVWDRDAVDMWFDDETPPPVAARARDAHRAAIRHQLAENAGKLVAA